jgi:hypothetical protein
MSAPQPPFFGVPRLGRLTTAERIYRVLLRAYPPAFRAEYSREMTQLFRDQYREGDGSTPAFWLTVVWDVARSAPALRMEARSARGRESIQTLGVIMKLVAILTVLLGVFGATNAVVEGVAGVRGTISGTYLLAIVLGASAGVLLLIAGIALLRRTPSGMQIATIASVASLVLLLAARLVHPWMSIFSQLAGVGLPVVLLAVLHWSRRRTPSISGAA